MSGKRVHDCKGVRFALRRNKAVAVNVCSTIGRSRKRRMKQSVSEDVRMKS